MIARLKVLLLCYLYWLLLFILQKPIFLLFQFSESSNYSILEWCKTVYHGFSMDLSTAGYCIVVPFLLLLISCFTPSVRWTKRSINAFNYFLIGLLSLLFVSDLFLYRYWGFRIDSTPLFYLRTPKDAFASGTWTEYICSFITLAIIGWCSYKLYKWFSDKMPSISPRAYLSSLPLLLSFGIIFIFIRGGIGVSTMNAGHVYFSESTFLNHAAINPTWNFLDSLTQEDDFSQQYRFMDDKEANALVTELNGQQGVNSTQVLKNSRPNILLIVMEGIGSNVIETLGGERNVTPYLNQYTQEGILFNNCFASSFRTDRGLVAILSGYPAQPTNSLMKYPNKTQNVPILTQNLKRNGYHTAFYYGGDDNFTNLHSYLVTAGYETIVNENDFKSSELSNKWGAYDHVLLQRVKEDLQNAEQPFFKTILTLNSHEPFDVPTHTLENPYLNSVHYADSCIGNFIEYLRRTEYWENTLVILLPDHAYRYPNRMVNSDPSRYRIPLIWIGGVIKERIVVEKVCSQIDLTATLLNQLQLPDPNYIFSKDILNENYPEYAFYSFIDGFGLIQKQDTSIYDCAADKIIRSNNEKTLQKGKAFLQSLYDDIANR